MNSYSMSDLAGESFSQFGGALSGAEYRVDDRSGFSVSRLLIRTDEAAEQLGQPRGCYVAFECGRLNKLSDERRERLSHLLAGELRGTARRLSGKEADGSFGVLVAGLGNAELTADAIGPKTVRYLTATRHLREHEGQLYRRLGCSSLSAIAPGVLGQTGIETLELLRGAVKYVRPDLVIVVDALAARSCERLAATVQVTDAGIRPGSGVGNRRAAINSQSLGVPVVALGVPTVVNSATLVYDALREAGIDEQSESLKRVLESGKSFFVSPKESDVITEDVARILSAAISRAFTAGLMQSE